MQTPNDEAALGHCCPACGNWPMEMSPDAKVQHWLAELSQHGNPTLVDGPHDDYAGVQRAAYLKEQLGFAKGKTLAHVWVVIMEVTPCGDGVDEESLDQCRAMIDRAKKVP